MPQSLPLQSPTVLPTGFSNIEELYTLYSRQAFGLALKVLEDNTAAESAVHEVFLRYWQQPGLYSAKKGPFLNWLLREVHCYCLDNLPHDHEYAKNSGPLSTEITFKKVGSSSEEASKQNHAQQVLAGLPQEQRNIVELAYFKGMSHLQIAQATGKSAQSVRQSLALGLLSLKRGITELNPV